MKPYPGALFLCVSLALAVEARATVLPDSCGDDKVRFSVSTEASQYAPAVPDSGKAQIIFVENSDRPLLGNRTVRVGVDGAWVGANRGNSYFALTVEPGVHHICASWQAAKRAFVRTIDAVSITTEPGGVYYVAAQFNSSGYKDANMNLALSQLNEDQGRYRVKAWKLATATPAR
jgi:hypothetical protein